jgi:hypothetical protein
MMQDDRDAVGKDDGVKVAMHFKDLMVMSLVFASRRFRFLVPVKSALSADHDQPLFDHP